MRQGGVGTWILISLAVLVTGALVLRLVVGEGPRVGPAPAPSAPAPSDEAGLRALARDPAVIATGAEIFAGLCWNCHGRAGEGTIQAPNLRDDWWIGGNDMTDLVRVIRDGRPGTAMQPMGQYYTPAQIAAVAAYVVSLKGSTGGNGKSPEGKLAPIAW
jgi:mono/diheme cytochrome c family protein